MLHVTLRLTVFEILQVKWLSKRVKFRPSPILGLAFGDPWKHRSQKERRHVRGRILRRSLAWCIADLSSDRKRKKQRNANVNLIPAHLPYCVWRVIIRMLTFVVVQQVSHSSLLGSTVDRYQMTVGVKRDTSLTGFRPLQLVSYEVIAAVDWWHVREVLRATYNVGIDTSILLYIHPSIHVYLHKVKYMLITAWDKSWTERSMHDTHNCPKI